jgi:Raf kinase inhibitor-like YbhB/YbcL family protein
MTITSTSFQDGDPIPKKHSLNGGNINPPLTFSEVPVEAKSLVLIVEDPDAPDGTWTHWLIYNMSQATLQIPEGGMPLHATQATNDFGEKGYGGPAPPSGTHRYIFKLFALDTELDNITPEHKRADVLDAIEGHVIDQAELTGTYSA